MNFSELALVAESTQNVAQKALENTTELVRTPIANAAVSAVHTSAETESVFASLGLDPVLFIAQLINFIIVAIILWYLVLKPLTKKMAERQEKIDEGLTNAERVEKNLHRSELKYQERIDQAKAESANIMEKARLEAVSIGEDLKNKSKQEIELLIIQAKNNIRIEKEEMLVEVKKYAAELVIVAMEKILEEKMDDKKDAELIKKSIKDLKI
ncbi:MAG: F0F1 ATP synthase subunit B [bacterium]